MTAYEYKVVPSPRKGKSARGMRKTPEKLANSLSIMMNDMASEGWEFQRADTLPCEERTGLRSKTVNYHSMLVFRRAIEQEVEAAPQPTEVTAPALIEPEPAPKPEPVLEPQRREPALQRQAEHQEASVSDAPQPQSEYPNDFASIREEGGHIDAQFETTSLAGQKRDTAAS